MRRNEMIGYGDSDCSAAGFVQDEFPKTKRSWILEATSLGLAISENVLWRRASAKLPVAP